MLGTFRRVVKLSGFTNEPVLDLGVAVGLLSSFGVALLTERFLSTISGPDTFAEDDSRREDWSRAGEVDFDFCSVIETYNCLIRMLIVNILLSYPMPLLGDAKSWSFEYCRCAERTD